MKIMTRGERKKAGVINGEGFRLIKADDKIERKCRCCGSTENVEVKHNNNAYCKHCNSAIITSWSCA